MQDYNEKVSLLVRTARGQIDGILRMMDDDRALSEISNQLLATRSILGKANREIVRAQMHNCIKQTFCPEGEREKVDEIMAVLDKMLKERA